LRFEGITRRLKNKGFVKSAWKKTREQARYLNITQQLPVRVSVSWIWRRLVFLVGSRRSSFAFLGVHEGVKGSFAFLVVDEGVKRCFALLGVDEGVKTSCFPWCG
jgi:hypothetical protein